MYNLSHILNVVPDAEIAGGVAAVFSNAKAIHEADELSIVWISSNHKYFDKMIEATLSKLIICDKNALLSDCYLTHKTFIKTANPRLAFLRVVQQLFVSKLDYGIHPSTQIHPEAKISQQVYIGPNVYIGKCVIEDDVIIYGNCFLYDGVHIGKHVTIHAGAIIGADGFGYQRNENNELEKFPHLGGVVIEDHVEIGSNTCIDKGTLGNTIIKEGAKIDNLVHIAHNVVIGRHVAVIAHAMIGGSTVIGDYSWISPCASVRDGITIGKNVTIGIASNVTKSVPDGTTWLGNPARPLEEYLASKKR